MQDFKPHRRHVFQALIALSAVGGLAACGDGEATGAVDEPTHDGGVFDVADMALIAALSEAMIPETDTGGAIAAGVPETLQALATEWGDDAFQAYWLAGIANLGTVLTASEGSDFSTLSSERQSAALAEYDARVFDGAIDDDFYRDFKSTVVRAYCMSEPGATETLAYEPVPGEWIGCVPLSDFPKNWAT